VSVPGDDLDVADVRPLGPQVVARKSKAVVPLARVRRRRFDRAGDQMPARSGQYGPKSPLVVDEELGKSPRPRLHVGQFH